MNKWCSLKKPLMRSLLDYGVTNKHRWHEQMDGHVNHGAQHQNKTKTQLMRMELWVWDRTFSSWFLRTGFWEIIPNSVGTRKAIYPFKWGGINAMLCNLVYTLAAPRKLRKYWHLCPTSNDPDTGGLESTVGIKIVKNIPQLILICSQCENDWTEVEWEWTEHGQERENRLQTHACKKTKNICNNKNKTTWK